MTDLLPLEQAFNLRFSLLEYLKTTFNLFEQDTTAALHDFLSDPKQGVFRGPFVRLRLPFAPAVSGWEKHLEVLPRFTPYGHQARAFARLSTLTNDHPQTTIITTGTGSGKTEAFLLPILDHAYRAKRQGIMGTKALILYPMNALANDQAQRLAKLITDQYPGVTAALYTGEGDPHGATMVSSESLITNREAIRAQAPDILLTNYKMLDQLLLRSEDAPIWRQSAESLKYLVMDEFHTYDGAQGTDVAMLLRRVGAALKSFWDPDSPMAGAHNHRPLGQLTLVATSATLGDEHDSSAIVDFAETIMGEPIDPAAVVTESRLTIEQWLDQPLTTGEGFPDRRLTPVMPNRLVFKEVEEAFSSEFVFADNKPWVSITQNPIRAAQILCGSLYTDPSDQLDLSDAEPLELLDLLRRHRFISLLIEHTEQAEDFNDLVQSLFPDYRGRERLRRGAGAFLLIMFSVLSQLRATCGRVALSVDVHLWIRELTRVDRIAGSDAPTFRWHDDGAATSQTAFPALYCRHCGRSGWGVVLAPTGPYLAHSDEEIRAERLRRNERFRPLLHVPAHDQAEQFTPQVSWFNTQARRVSVEEPDLVEVEEGTTIPVITHVGEEAGEKSLNDVCPSCGAKDAIRFLGSAVATQLSVALGALFGAEGLKEEEKKALVFTDSVQDAAHRAGFVGARSHVFTLRSLMRDYIDTDHITLDRLADALVREAGSDAHARHRLLSPDIAEREAFRSFWQDPSRLPQALRERVRRRLSFDVGLEFGLRTTVGRTLEATTTVAVGVAFTNPEIVNAAKAALDQAGVAQLVSGVDETTLVRWVRAIMMHMRLRGAIDHPWWNSYRKHEGNRWFLGGGRRRDEGMPGFGMRQSVPAFPYVGRISRKDSEFEPIASERGWYAGWTAKCLEHGRAEAATIVTLLFKELAKRGMVGTFDTIGGATTFHLVPDAIRVQATSVDDAAEGRLAVACNACGSLTRGIPYFVDALVGGPCLVHRCAGVLTRLPQGDNYYRQMYMARDPKRVVAREHTALLPTDVRLEYETQFKQASDNPAAPNVLVATPTLEMGIDIGDLSTVMLSSLPKTVASYVQRVGRAGRLTGNALTVAFVTARGSQLPLFHRPQRVINGQVNPPATYLDAVEILRRQYLAFVVDHLARAGAVSPGRAVDVFALENPEGFLPQVIDTAEQPDMVEAFIAAFPHANPDVMAELRAWTQTEHPHESALATRCKTVAHAFNVELENLRHREREILEVIGPLQQRAELPAASIQDKEDYGIAESALKQTRSLIKGRTRQHWVAALEAAGLLPNYTLIDDSVELNVSLSWFDPETERYANESFNLDRASAQALREFAPGSTFYSRGYAIDIDAIDFDRAGGGTHQWWCCPGCGFVHEHRMDDIPATCPRCGNAGIADASQRLDTVPLTHVSAAMRRNDAVIDDGADERRQRFYSIATLVDVDPQRARSWFVEETWFGVRYCPELTIRWVNLGGQTSRSAVFTASGREYQAGQFYVCSACGKVNPEPGRNERRHHRPWCTKRDELEDPSRPVCLTRTLQTEGVVLRLPTDITLGNPTAVPSLKATLMLALAMRLGGAPTHLGVETIKDPTAHTDNNPEALLIYDTVPGGTGYLAEFTTPENIHALLREVATKLWSCSCKDDDAGPLACEDCLLPYVSTRDITQVSRVQAYRALIRLLTGEHPSGEGPEKDLPETVWETTLEEPKPPSHLSHLEQLFKQQFRERLQADGVRLEDVPGQAEMDLRITLEHGNQWSLEVWPDLNFTKPDFALRCPDAAIPNIYIYTDGRQFHASKTNPIVGEDAIKRDQVRNLSESPKVLAFCMEDLEDNPPPTPWYTTGAKQMLLGQGGVTRNIETMITTTGVSMLRDWVKNPDPTAMAALGNALPIAFIKGVYDQSHIGSVTTVSSGVVDLAQLARYALEHSAKQAVDNHTQFTTPAKKAGQTVVAVYKHGSVALALQTFNPSETGQNTRKSERARVALVLDDSQLGIETQEYWREWLHLSNLLGWRTDPTTITVASQVAQVGGDVVVDGPEGSVDVGQLNPQWQEALEEALDDERSFLEQLAIQDPNMPAPQVGVECGSHNTPVVAVWEDVRLAVVADEHEAQSLQNEGWHVVVMDHEKALTQARQRLVQT